MTLSDVGAFLAFVAGHGQPLDIAVAVVLVWLVAR